ncbi:helix-turn-helix domain-containing protein [Lysinibacillus fusiformis]|nr:helix-turn-helix domain-containing protein [Lysinibacillus fusiformis]
MEEVYSKIKELRVKQNMTLKDLAEKTGLSLSFISQVERGATSLSITSLQKIAVALDVSMNYFFEEDVPAEKYVVRKNERHQFKTNLGSQIYTRLAGSFGNRKLEPLLVTLPPKIKEDQKYSHNGEEFYYVIEGEVIFYVNDEKHHLHVGDTIHFPSSLQHQWENPLEINSSVISIVIPIIF